MMDPRQPFLSEYISFKKQKTARVADGKKRKKGNGIKLFRFVGSRFFRGGDSDGKFGLFVGSVVSVENAFRSGRVNHFERFGKLRFRFRNLAFLQ